GAGVDAIFLASSAVTNVTVDGGSEADSLEGPTSGTHEWRITNLNAGTLDPTRSFLNVANLLSFAGVDVFRFNAGKGVSGAIDTSFGGGGFLDYSLYTTSVVVDLMTGAATGVAGGVVGINNVTGGQADDLLRGNDNANGLFSLGGNDILVGMGGDD